MVVPGTSESVACGAHVPGAVTVEMEVIYTVTPPVASVVVEAIMVGSADVEDDAAADADEDAVIELAEDANEVAEVATAPLALDTAELAAEAAPDTLAAPPPPDPACPPISAPC